MIKEYHFKNDLNWEGLVSIYYNENINLDNDTTIILTTDGQGIFNNENWNLEKIFNNSKKSFLVIGVHTSDQIFRFENLSPFDLNLNEELEKDFENFFLKTFKKIPKNNSFKLIDYISKDILNTILINLNLKNNKNIYIMGMSMGGIFATITLSRYANLFKGAIIMSPAYWYNFNEVLKYIEDNPIENKKIFIHIGTKESEGIVNKFYFKDAKKIENILNKKNNVVLNILENGYHDQSIWAQEFKNKVINWLEMEK